MNNIKKFAGLFFAAVIFQISSLSASESYTSRIKIGIYDSRSIAIAYCGSEGFKKDLKNLKDKYNEAKIHNNKDIMKKISNEGKELQNLFHKQAFGTYPVENILETIKDKIPGIKEKTGVSLILSKWNKKELSKYKNCTKINITESLIKAFNPDKKQYQRAIEIQNKEPSSEFTLFMMKLFH